MDTLADLEKHITVAVAVAAAKNTTGPGATIAQIMAELTPDVGYTRDWREIALRVAPVVAYNLNGDPLRNV